LADKADPSSGQFFLDISERGEYREPTREFYPALEPNNISAQPDNAPWTKSLTNEPTRDLHGAIFLQQGLCRGQLREKRLERRAIPAGTVGNHGSGAAPIQHFAA
jgi:hypothetical protein